MIVKPPVEIHYKDLPWNGQLPSQVRTDWEYLVKCNSQTPVFNYPEWFGFACSAGIIQPRRLLLFYAKAHPIGLLPLQQRAPMVWEAVTHFAQDSPTLLLDPAEEETVWIGIGKWLRNNPWVGMLSLGFYESGRSISCCRQVLEPQGIITNSRQQPPTVLLPLADNWEAFVRGLSKPTRKQMHSIETHLREETDGVSVQLLDDVPRCMEAFDDLVRLYRRRWGAQVGGSIFCTQAHVDFYRNAVKWALVQGYASMPTLRIHDKTAVVCVVFHIPGQLVSHFQFIARDTEVQTPHWLSSPGTLLTMLAFRWAIARGVKMVNLGQGSTHYKTSLGGNECDLWQLSIARSPATAKVLPHIARSLYVIQRLPLHLSYHLQRLTCAHKQYSDK